MSHFKNLSLLVPPLTKVHRRPVPGFESYGFKQKQDDE